MRMQICAFHLGGSPRANYTFTSANTFSLCGAKINELFGTIATSASVAMEREKGINNNECMHNVEGRKKTRKKLKK
jgi:hypothetical protein